MMLLLSLVLMQDVERELAECWGPLLYEVETARLAYDDVLAELKAKELPADLEGERLELWRFRLAGDLEPRCARIRELAKEVDVLQEPLKGLDPKAPPPAALVAAVREGFAAAKRRQAAAFAKDAAAEVRWIERQIRELYEPLVRLNAQGLAAVRGYQKSSGDDADQARWKVWAERSFLPRNEETRKAVAAGASLVEGEGFSEPFLAFLAHQHSWAQRHRRWEKEKGDYDWGSRTNWPVAFSAEVEATYQKLLDRRARLVAK